MKKAIIAVLLLGLCAFGLYETKEYFKYQKEKKRKDAYYENLVDTSSPTVSVLRDSILIDYQNEKRTLHVYVPPNYAQDTTIRYPVLYVLDGESSFNDLENMGPEWQIDEVINAAHSKGQQTYIVISINQSDKRDAEYTPFVNDDNPDAHGDKFTEWVATDLKSWVDTHYRTQTNASSTGILGISRSGMMAYYMMMAYPDIFGIACIQSPAMWADHDRLINMSLTADQLKNKKIFVSVGEKEGPMVPHAQEIYQKFKAQGLGPDQLKYEVIKGEGHWHITWRKSFALFYPWLIS